MANTLEFANKFLPIIDEVYKANSKTSFLDSAIDENAFTGVDQIKVLKTSTTGLGNYTRNDGYPKGNINASWEMFELVQERAVELGIDRMDNEEMLANVFGNVVGKFMREHVIPELDAYRFTRYCNKAGQKKEGDLTKTDIWQAVDEAVKYQDSEEVPEGDRVLFINSNLKPTTNTSVNRMWTNEKQISTMIDNYNGIPIIFVPPKRFYSAITLNSGVDKFGYEKTASTGKDINFILMRTDGLVQGVKFAMPKIFSPDVNQENDSWKFQYRNYHDVDVLENKKAGIYAHYKTT